MLHRGKALAIERNMKDFSDPNSSNWQTMRLFPKVFQ